MIVFAVALGLRLIHIFQIREAPFFATLMGDARSYDEWAQRITGGAWLGGDVFYQAPLYPYFLGTLYSLAGRDLLLVRLVQAAVGSVSCVMLGLAAARLFSPRAGLAAGLLLAVYSPAIFFDGLIQKSVLDVFFMCLSIWLMSGIVAERDVVSGFRGTSRRWLLLGLALGGLALTRENALVLAAVILVWAVVKVPLKPDATYGLRPVRLKADTTYLRAAAFVLGLALVLTPVAIRNYAVGGGFYVTTSQFGPNFYIGNNPRSDGTYQSLRFGRGAPEYERQDATELAEKALGRTLTPSEVSSFWTDRSLAFITAEPGRWAALMARKFFLLWNADEMLDTESQELYAEFSLPLRSGSWIMHFGILVPLAVIGVFASWPERRRLWVFHAMTLAYALSVVMFYVFARYRFPLVPLLVLFAARGLLDLWDVVVRPMWAAQKNPPHDGTRHAPAAADAPGPALRVSAAMAVSFVAAAVFTNWPALSKPLMRSISETNLAAALQGEGRLDAAIAHYQRSIAMQPTYAPAHNNLGTALRASGRVDDAIASYQRALEAVPDYPDAHYNLANALLEKQRPSEAAEHFRIALKSISGSAGVHNNLGIALAEAGKLEEALAEFRAALLAEPQSAKANQNVGKALSTLGRPQEGIPYLRRAVELNPNDKDAHYDLGSDLLETNQASDAVKEFRAALAIDPAWAAAHNNLAIALASTGQLDEAIEHFRRTLASQPDFPGAKDNLAVALAQKKSR